MSAMRPPPALPGGPCETRAMTVQPHAPEPLAAWMGPFMTGLTRPTWRHALVLVAGAILAPGRRTVAAVLRVVGLGQAPTFTNYHRVLNRNRWSGRAPARPLLPLLPALAPSERFAREHGRRHKRLTDRARQLLLLVARWLPGRRLVAVADSSYAAIELLAAVCRRLTVVTRLRLDARLFDPPPPGRPGPTGRPRVSCAAGRSRGRSPRCAGTSGWRRSASGRTWGSRGPRRGCSACSRW